MTGTAHTNAPRTRQADSAPIQLRYFNGRSSKADIVLLYISELSVQLIRGLDGVLLREMPLKGIRWPERTAHGARIIELPDGGQLHAGDARAYDAWAAAHLPKPESWVVRAQQSWRGVLASFAALMLTLAALYYWGLPVAARGITSIVPISVDEALGSQALRQIDSGLMKPSKLPTDTQLRLRARLATAMQRAYPAGMPAYQLEFRQSTIGPNAFALPGGTMVLTDELVNLVNDDEVVMGVLGHEMGHVTERHGMRQLVQLAVLQGALGIAFGDYGSLITAAPLILGSMAYSRDAERQADVHSIRFMQANSISPLVMVKFFSIMRAEQQAKSKSKNKSADTSPALDISIISSHPADAERMEKFKNAAR
jgi:Zn-dependent protease with chaperone function